MAIDELYNNNLSFRLAATGIAGIATIATGSRFTGLLGEAIRTAIEKEKERQQRLMYVDLMMEFILSFQSNLTWDDTLILDNSLDDYQSAIDRLNENLGLNRLPEVKLMEHIAPGLMAKVWVQMQFTVRMLDKFDEFWDNEWWKYEYHAK